jgi:ATP-dependent DNA ligase
MDRRERLETVRLHGSTWHTSPRFDDGDALTAVMVDRGREGVVAKKLRGSYRPRTPRLDQGQKPAVLVI